MFFNHLRGIQLSCISLAEGKGHRSIKISKQFFGTLCTLYIKDEMIMYFVDLYNSKTKLYSCARCLYGMILFISV